MSAPDFGVNRSIFVEIRRSVDVEVRRSVDVEVRRSDVSTQRATSMTWLVRPLLPLDEKIGRRFVRLREFPIGNLTQVNVLARVI